MATKHLKTYRDSRGQEWKISEMKTAKLAAAFNKVSRTHKTLVRAINVKGYANPAQERKQVQLAEVKAALKAELVLRNPFDLEGILNGS